MVKYSIEDLIDGHENIIAALEDIQNHLERLNHLLQDFYPEIVKVRAIETMLADFFSLMRQVDIPDSRFQ